MEVVTMIQFQCKCGRRLDFPDSELGKSVRCKYCRAKLRAVAATPEVNLQAAEDLVSIHDDDFICRLIVVAGPRHLGEQIVLGGFRPIEVGKLSSLNLQLLGSLVSRHHARLSRTPDGGWMIEDRDSTNGVYVNGKKISAVILRQGDRVRIGNFIMRYFDAIPRKKSARPATASPNKPALQKKQAPLLALAKLEADQPTLPEPQTSSSASVYAASNQSFSSQSRIEGKTLTSTAQITGAVGLQICPSCKKILSPSATICTDCGIYASTGRPLHVARMIDVHQLFADARRIIHPLSVFQVVTGNFGAVAVLFYFVQCFLNSEAPNILAVVAFFYLLFPYGVCPIASEAYGASKPTAVWSIVTLTSIASASYWIASAFDLPLSPTFDQAILWPQHSENFRWWQLMTHTFLHADLSHLIANMILLAVIGSRVNALIGNVGTVIAYLTLSVLAAQTQLVSSTTSPMLGASGAVMGLTGMYLIFFPVQKMYVAAWVSWGIIKSMHFTLKIWAVRGLWFILVYFLAFDLLYLVLGLEDHIAHWAHLGGFLSGAALALLLLLTRAVNPRGGDILSVTFGQVVWPLVGSPWHWAGQKKDGWLQRWRLSRLTPHAA